MRAYFKGKLNGRNVYLFPVKVLRNDSRRLRTVAVDMHHVLAYTTAEAANFVRDMYRHRPETEIYAYGPKGGETARYIGWFSAIGNTLSEFERRQRTLTGELHG